MTSALNAHFDWDHVCQYRLVNISDDGYHPSEYYHNSLCLMGCAVICD
jgi:hypothetical protein